MTTKPEQPFFPHATVTLVSGTISIDATAKRVTSLVIGDCSACGKALEGAVESVMFHLAKHADEGIRGSM